MDRQPPKKMPPSLGGGEVSTTALKLLQRSEFRDVAQPELIAECVVRWLGKQDAKARSGIRAVIGYYNRQNRHGKLVKFLRKIYNHE